MESFLILYLLRLEIRVVFYGEFIHLVSLEMGNESGVRFQEDVG